MPKDAKLGLVLGLVVVAVIAVVFFRKEPLSVPSAAPAPSADASPAKGPAPVVAKAPKERPPQPRAEEAVPLPPPTLPEPMPLPPPSGE